MSPHDLRGAVGGTHWYQVLTVRAGEGPGWREGHYAEATTADDTALYSALNFPGLLAADGFVRVVVVQPFGEPIEVNRWTHQELVAAHNADGEE